MDQTRRCKGIIRCCDQHTFLLLRPLNHARVDLGLPTDDYTTCILLDGDKLARRDISHDDQIIILDLITHGLPVAGCHDDLALGKIGMIVACHHAAVDGLDDIAILGLGTSQNTVIQDIHIGICDISIDDQTSQTFALIHDRQGNNIQRTHEFPCLFQREMTTDTLGLTIVNILDLGTGIRDQPRFFCPKTLQHITCLIVDAPRSLCDKMTVLGLIFQICI